VIVSESHDNVLVSSSSCICIGCMIKTWDINSYLCMTTFTFTAMIKTWDVYPHLHWSQWTYWPNWPHWRHWPQ